MKVWLHNYFLTRGNLKPHAGALFKIEFTESLTGYADIHPWPELEEKPLHQQLGLVLDGKPTPAFYKSLGFAKIDAEARRAGISLMNGLKIPESHFFVSDLESLTFEKLLDIADRGFKILKVKIFLVSMSFPEIEKIKELASELERLNLKLRLDFNASGDFAKADGFFSVWFKEFRHFNLIDFVEDPCLFVAQHWQKLKSRWGIKLALDHQLKYVESKDRRELGKFADILIFKPSHQLAEEITALAKRNNLQISVTTSLDHALGIMSATFEAAKINEQNPGLITPCGLVSHGDFSNDGFFSKIPVRGPKLQDFSGSGFGFDEELAKLKWNFFL